MGQGMRVTVNAAMRARDVSRVRPEDEGPRSPAPAATPRTVTQPTRGRRAEKRRLAKRRAAQA